MTTSDLHDMKQILQQAKPITISSTNCKAVTGMSWCWVQRFARAHDVPIWHVGERKRLIDARAFEAAMQRQTTTQGE